MKQRFTKAAVLAYIERRTNDLMAEHRFDRNNGTAQIKDGYKGRAIAYGEFKALETLADEIAGGYIVEESK